MLNKIFLTSIALGSILLSTACDTLASVRPTPVVYQPVPENISNFMIAEGEVVPDNDLQIFSPTTGKIIEIVMEEGQTIKENQVLLRFEVPEKLLAELKAAELDLLKAELALDDLHLYGDLQKQNAYQRVLDARTARRAAQAAWDAFDEQEYEDDLETIKEDVIDARQELKDAEEDLKDFLDLDKDNPQRKNRQADVDEAQIKLNELERKQAELAQSFEQLKLKLDLTFAKVETAEAEYRKYRANNIPEDQFTLADEQKAVAQARIAALQASMDELEITTPINGTIVNINVQVGEWISIGQPIAVIADFSTWYVESTDTNELEIVDIQVGDTVTLEFDAFPGKAVRGRVIEIKDFPVMKYNDVIYTH